MSRNKSYIYKSFEDDFFDDGKPHKLKADYVWIKSDMLSKIKSSVVYFLAVVFGTFYCRLFLHMKIKNAGTLRKCKTGFILYGNHTQPVGDVFTPALVCFPKRIYTVVSPANFDLPIIGKILSPLGALPIPDSINAMREFGEAIEQRLKEKHPIIIYPEAHVWPYYTGIRPFPSVSFKYADKYGVPVFAMTVTYQKRKFGKKPKMTVYIDGPFYSSGKTAKEKAENLKNTVLNCMTENSKKSNCEYVKYKKEI